MLATDHRPDRTAADQLYYTLTRAHSPYAAALMTAAVTGQWPNDFRFPTYGYPARLSLSAFNHLTNAEK